MTQHRLAGVLARTEPAFLVKNCARALRECCSAASLAETLGVARSRSRAADGKRRRTARRAVPGGPGARTFRHRTPASGGARGPRVGGAGERAGCSRASSDRASNGSRISTRSPISSSCTIAGSRAAIESRAGGPAGTEPRLKPSATISSNLEILASPAQAGQVSFLPQSARSPSRNSFTPPASAPFSISTSRIHAGEEERTAARFTC